MMTNTKKYGILLTGIVSMGLSLVFAWTIIRPIHNVSDGKRSQNDSLNAVFQKCIDDHFLTLETYVTINDSIEKLGTLKYECDSIIHLNDSLSRMFLIQLSDSAHALAVKEKVKTYLLDSLRPFILRANTAEREAALIEKSLTYLQARIQQDVHDTTRLQKEINQLKEELSVTETGKGKKKNKKKEDQDSIQEQKKIILQAKEYNLKALCVNITAANQEAARLTTQKQALQQTQKEQHDQLVDFIHRAVNDNITLKTADDNNVLNQCVKAIAESDARKTDASRLSEEIKSLKIQREELTAANKNALAAISHHVFVDSIPIHRKKFRLRSGGPLYSLYVVNTALMDMRIDDNRGRGATLMSQFKQLQATGTEPIAMMNGGMFNPDYGPTGLLITPNKYYRLNETSGTGNFYLNPNGVFLIDDKGKGEVLARPDFVKKYGYKPAQKKVANVKYATQSGPMLVINSKINKLFTKGSTNLNVRNGIGTLSN
ncbi:MAG: phosphodiester glycosidase family protein, partial [Ferruginibacter sp.]